LSFEPFSRLVRFLVHGQPALRLHDGAGGAEQERRLVSVAARVMSTVVVSYTAGSIWEATNRFQTSA